MCVVCTGYKGPYRAYIYIAVFFEAVRKSTDLADGLIRFFEEIDGLIRFFEEIKGCY